MIDLLLITVINGILDRVTLADGNAHGVVLFLFVPEFAWHSHCIADRKLSGTEVIRWPLFAACVSVFNLVNNEDVEETKRKVEAHKRDNKELIQHNKFKKVSSLSGDYHNTYQESMQYQER